MSSLLTTILANIPWGQVVESAPKIAQGAGRLWEKVRKRTEPAVEPSGPGAGTPLPDLAQLQQQVASLQAQLCSLEDEMRTSAQLVKELAELNARLVEQLQALQRQARLALWCVAALLGVALLAALLAWPA